MDFILIAPDIGMVSYKAYGAMPLCGVSVYLTP